MSPPAGTSGYSSKASPHEGDLSEQWSFSNSQDEARPQASTHHAYNSQDQSRSLQAPTDRFENKKHSKTTVPSQEPLPSIARSLTEFWKQTQHHIKQELNSHYDKNGKLNIHGELFYARAYVSTQDYAQSLKYYDKILMRFDSNQEVLATQIDTQSIIQERQQVYQQQLNALETELLITFEKLSEANIDPKKSLSDNFNKIRSRWNSFEKNIFKLLEKIDEVKNPRDRRALLLLLFSQASTHPVLSFFKEYSEQILAKTLDSIELSLRKRASHEERLETYYSLLVSLDSVKMDSLQQRIVSQGDAVAAKLSQVASDGKSTTQRVSDLVLAQKYYQRRGKSQAVQEIDLHLRRQQDVISRTIKSDSSPASTKLAKLSSDIDQTVLEHHETKPTGEGLLSPMLRAERHARHLAERAMLELQLKDKSSFQRWTTVQELSLQAARDQQEAQLKDSALNPEILKIAHPLLQEKLLDPLLQEFFFAQNQEDILASGLESESRLPDDFEERQKTLSLFKQRYAKALSKGDTAWMLRYLSAHGLSSWSNTVKQAYQTSKRADASQGIVQLRLYHNAIAHFAQLGLETEVRQISQKILAQGRALLNHPETLHLNYRQASTMPEHFGILDYWALLLKVAKLCQNHKLPQESNFLLNEIIASQDQRYLSSQENFSDADIETQRQNLIDLAMAYRFENNGQRLQAQKLLQEIASRGFVIENLIENESPLTHLDSIELVATRPVIPATELKDKIEAEELFQSNMAAVGALSLYFAELEERYRIRAHSIRGQITDDVVRAYRADGSDRNDDLTRSLQKARGLCDKLAYKLITGEIKSLKAGLQVKDSELSDRELYDLMELMASIDRQFHGLQKNRSAFADLGFQDDIAPTLIEFVSTYPRNLKLAYRLLNLADQVEVHESGLLGPLAIYRLVEDLASEGEETWLNSRYISTDSIQKRARSNRDRLTGRADFAQATGKFIRSMDATEIAFEVGLLFVSGGLGSLVRTSLMRESASGLTKAALQRAVTPSLSFRIPALRHAASLEQVFANSMGFAVNYNTFNFGSIAHDMWVGNPDAEQMLYGSIARGITLVGFELGGPLSRALAERGARGLGMVQTTGHLSNAGQSLLRHGTHVGGLSVAMGAGTLNEELGLSPLPPGGPNEAYLIHAFGYAQLIWAKALVNKALGGKLAAFEHQPQLEYTVLLARHRVQIVLQKNKISISPAEEAILVDYLAQARLTRPDFNDQEFSKLLNAIQGYVLANENKGESDRLSFYRQAQALLDEAGVPLTLIAEEILTSNEARLLRFDWKNPQTAPAEKIELPEQDIPSTLEGAQANTDPDLNNHASGFKNNLPGLGLLVFFWQGFAMPWISGEPADPITAPLIAGMVEVKGNGRKRGNGNDENKTNDGDGDRDEDAASPDPAVTSTLLASDPTALAEPLGKSAQQLISLKEDSTLLKVIKSSPSFSRGRPEAEVIAGWEAWVATLDHLNRPLLDLLVMLNDIPISRSETQSILVEIIKKPSCVDLLSNLSAKATHGLSTVANMRNKNLLKLILFRSEIFQKQQQQKILEAISSLENHEVRGRYILFNQLADPRNINSEKWQGYPKGLILAGQHAQELAELPAELRPPFIEVEPQLGYVDWDSPTAERPLSRSVNPDLCFLTPQGHRVLREYKSPVFFSSKDPKMIQSVHDFKVQSEGYSQFIRKNPSEAGISIEYYFYGEVPEDVQNFLKSTFADLDLRIYVVNEAQQSTLIFGKALEIKAAIADKDTGPANTKQETPRSPETGVETEATATSFTTTKPEAGDEIPSLDLEAEAMQPPAAPRPRRAPPFASNVTDAIRSRFSGSEFESFFESNEGQLFFVSDRKELVAFHFNPEAQEVITRKNLVEASRKKLEEKLHAKAAKSSPDILPRIQTVGLWLSEVLGLIEDDVYANSLYRDYLEALNPSDYQSVLERLEKLFSRQLRAESVVIAEDRISLRSPSSPDNILQAKEDIPRARYYLYLSPEQSSALNDAILRDSTGVGYPFFADTVLYSQAQADYPPNHPVILIDINLTKIDAKFIEHGKNQNRIKKTFRVFLSKEDFEKRVHTHNNRDLFATPHRLDVETALWMPEKSEEQARPPVTDPVVEPAPSDQPLLIEPTTVLSPAPPDLGRLYTALNAMGICAKINARNGSSLDAEAIVHELAQGETAVETQRNLELLASLREEATIGLATLLDYNPKLDATCLWKKLLAMPGSREVRQPYGLSRAELFLIAVARGEGLNDFKKLTAIFLNHAAPQAMQENIDRMIDHLVDFKKLKKVIQAHYKENSFKLIYYSEDRWELQFYQLNGEKDPAQFTEAKRVCEKAREKILARADHQDIIAQYLLYDLSQLPELLSRLPEKKFNKLLKELERLSDRPLAGLRNEIQRCIKKALTENPGDPYFSEKLDVTVSKPAYSAIQLGSATGKQKKLYLYLSYEDFLLSAQAIVQKQRFYAPPDTPMTEELLTSQQLEELSKADPRFANKAFVVEVSVPERVFTGATKLRLSEKTINTYNVPDGIDQEYASPTDPYSIYQEVKPFVGMKTLLPLPESMGLEQD